MASLPAPANAFSYPTRSSSKRWEHLPSFDAAIDELALLKRP